MNCPKCGAEATENASFCEYCGQSLKEEVQAEPVTYAPEQQSVPAAPQQQSAPAVPEKKENFLAGIVGALIGAAIGGAAIVLLNYLGYIASISGLILAICTIKGYELLGGKMSTKGIVVCIVLMLLTPYIADRISWAIAIKEAYVAEGVTFAEAFAVVHLFVAEGAIAVGDYIKDLLLLYAFTLLGAFATVKDLFKKK